MIVVPKRTFGARLPAYTPVKPTHASGGNDGHGKRAWARVAGKIEQWNQSKSAGMKRAAAAAKANEAKEPKRLHGPQPVWRDWRAKPCVRRLRRCHTD